MSEEKPFGITCWIRNFNGKPIKRVSGDFASGYELWKFWIKNTSSPVPKKKKNNKKSK